MCRLASTPPGGREEASVLDEGGVEAGKAVRVFGKRGARSRKSSVFVCRERRGIRKGSVGVVCERNRSMKGLCGEDQIGGRSVGVG